MASPLIEQYLELKAKHPDKILFFRLGDFYEMFYEDAVEISSALNLVLTKRKNKTDGEIPMCGIPYHSSEGYLEKLIQQGYQVAVAEQIEKAGPGKDLVKRDVVKIVTKSTILLESSSEEIQETPHIASLQFQKKEVYVTLLNTINGKIILTKIEQSLLSELLKRYQVYEVISSKLLEEVNVGHVRLPAYVAKRTQENLEILKGKLGVYSLDVFNVPRGTFFEKSLSGMIWYLENLHAQDKIMISDISFEKENDALIVDEQTRKNLEIFPVEAGRKTLWDVVNKTKTPMGQRVMYDMLANPIQNQSVLQKRVDTIDWIKNKNLFQVWQQKIQGIKDIERLLAKVAYGNIAPTQMLELTEGIHLSKSLIREVQTEYKDINVLDYIHQLDVDESNIEKYIDSYISPEATNNPLDGKLIKYGVSEELDELKKISKNAKEWILKYQNQLKQELNIPTLKVGFNKVFGYYVEVSKAHRDKIPNKYHKKQTLVNAERFITEELKEYESKILTAQDRIIEIEKNMFHDVCGKVVDNSRFILNLAKTTSYIDVMSALAKVSSENNYCKPTYASNGSLEIHEGRHPIVETILPKNEFIPNSITFDNSQNTFILTGPNMGGKSTFIRQIALITYMAHVGLHVPAKKAILPSVDRIFSRVGASDNLSQGMSTFMVEMTEVANILKHATSSSLVILDEVGRGTATADGRAIAKSVLEYLHTESKPKIIFATHFHELADLESKFSGIHNLHVSVGEKDKQLIFYHQILAGRASKSYGIEIARLAGVSTRVIKKAFQYLEESEQHTHFQQPSIFEMTNTAEVKDKNESANGIIQALQDIEINTLTPLEALQKLNTLKELLYEENS
jgi:DNA mismatch repair protein MutS